MHHIFTKTNTNSVTKNDTEYNTFIEDVGTCLVEQATNNKYILLLKLRQTELRS